MNRNFEKLFYEAKEEILSYFEIEKLKKLEYEGFEKREVNLKPSELAKYIDHTFLKPDGTQERIKALCEEALEYKFASICINPCWISFAKDILKGKVSICTVIGFPLGAMTTEAKKYETKDAILKGADEIDMVINIGFLKSKKYKEIYDEIKEIKEVCGEKILKVILENCLLNDIEKSIGCLLSKLAGADYVKTSTGFSTGGATFDDVLLMKNVVGKNVKVKAAGGIRDYKTAVEMIQNGADRIGASAGVKIINS